MYITIEYDRDNALLRVITDDNVSGVGELSVVKQGDRTTYLLQSNPTPNTSYQMSVPNDTIVVINLTQAGVLVYHKTYKTLSKDSVARYFSILLSD